MHHISDLDWEDHIRTGRKYLETAVNGLARPAVFNNTLIFQLTAMAVEKLLVGVFQYNGKMPCGHTLDGLVDELSLFCPLDKDLAEKIKELGRFDDMCPLVPVNRIIPDAVQIKAILAVGDQVAEFAGRQVKSADGGTQTTGSKGWIDETDKNRRCLQGRAQCG